ncbi:hypothetical protein [Brevundimonas sp. TWP2-3-4b1]|uniref:hypothetical protein n=1 Tax=Brevundimonas sp. TWP2-3-4b1 TaxID=2804580 RepID=UPI003CF9C45D
MLDFFITYLSSREGKTVAAIVAVSLMVLIVASSANLMIDVGAAAHDAFCPDHGWAV